MTPPRNRTGRKYGEVSAQIIAILKRKKRITVLDLPNHPRHSASNALLNLLGRGQIELIEKASIGRYAKPAVYGLKKAA